MPTLDELDDHEPVPTPHTPNVIAIQDGADSGGFALAETTLGVADGRWIRSDAPVEARQ